MIGYGPMFRIADKEFIGQLENYVKEAKKFLRRYDMDKYASKQIAANLFASGDQPDDSTTVTIKEKGNATESDIYEDLKRRIEENGNLPTVISRKEISETTGYAIRTVAKWIASLVKKGLIKQEITSYLDMQQTFMERTYSLTPKNHEP